MFFIMAPANTGHLYNICTAFFYYYFIFTQTLCVCGGGGGGGGGRLTQQLYKPDDSMQFHLLMFHTVF